MDKIRINFLVLLQLRYVGVSAPDVLVRLYTIDTYIHRRFVNYTQICKDPFDLIKYL